MSESPKEQCQRLYLESALPEAEAEWLELLFDTYKSAEALSSKEFLGPEVHFSGPTVRRASFEKKLSRLFEKIGGQTIPCFTARKDLPSSYTSHYSLFRVGDVGATVSSTWDEYSLPRPTEYRHSLISGIELVLFDLGDIEEPDEKYLYLLFKHGRRGGSLADSTIPQFAKFHAFDSQGNCIWTRDLYRENIDFVGDLLGVQAEDDPDADKGIVQLKQHLQHLKQRAKDA